MTQRCIFEQNYVCQCWWVMICVPSALYYAYICIYACIDFTTTHSKSVPRKCCTISASIFIIFVSVSGSIFSCCSLAVLVPGSRLGRDVQERFCVSLCEITRDLHAGTWWNVGTSFLVYIRLDFIFPYFNESRSNSTSVKFAARIIHFPVKCLDRHLPSFAVSQHDLSCK